MIKTKNSIHLGGSCEEGLFYIHGSAVVGAIGAISSLASGASTIANSDSKKKAEDKKFRNEKT